jgi:hypothetical protein
MTPTTYELNNAQGRQKIHDANRRDVRGLIIRLGEGGP